MGSTPSSAPSATRGALSLVLGVAAAFVITLGVSLYWAAALQLTWNWLVADTSPLPTASLGEALGVFLIAYLARRALSDVTYSDQPPTKAILAVYTLLPGLAILLAYLGSLLLG